MWADVKQENRKEKRQCQSSKETKTKLYYKVQKNETWSSNNKLRPFWKLNIKKLSSTSNNPLALKYILKVHEQKEKILFGGNIQNSNKLLQNPHYIRKNHKISHHIHFLKLCDCFKRQ